MKIFEVISNQDEDSILLKDKETGNLFGTDEEDFTLLLQKETWEEQELIPYNSAEDTNVPKKLRYRVKRFNGLNVTKNNLLKHLFRMHVSEEDSMIAKCLEEKLGMGVITIQTAKPYDNSEEVK